MKLGIVIVHYNTSADLSRCLESLAAYPPTAPHEIVVVDNASEDAGLAAVHRTYAHCHWHFNTANVGYARGCNQGMAAVAADYYLVLNPDIVVQPGALDGLLDFADRHPRAGMVGPQLLNEDGSIQHSCRRFYTLKTLLLRRTLLGRIFPNSETVKRHLMLDFDHEAARPVDWVLGGCLLVRSTAMARTGPMDERFFLYFEDVDWCYRMWQAGFEVQYVPSARFIHRHRRDSAQRRFSRSFWLHLGSMISFYEKWGMLIWLLKKWRDPLLMLVWWLVDLAGLTVAFWSAYGLRALAGGLFAERLFPAREYLPLLFFAGLLASGTFWLSGRYRPDGLRVARGHIRQIGIVGVLLLASTYLGHQEVISRAVLLLFIPLLLLATSGGAWLLRRLLRDLERGHFSLERTLLAGSPSQVQPWLDSARDLAQQGVDVAGYLTDMAAGGQLPALGGGEVPWLGSRDETLAVVRRYRISQVVFWDRPTTAADWRLLAELRRLRVHLRWHGGDAWLLATSARAEIFGADLSAVQTAGSGLAIRTLANRLVSLLAGLALGLVSCGPRLWLDQVRTRRGSAAWKDLVIADLWGHNPRLKVAVDRHGKLLPLPWQWHLARALVQGRIALVGPQLGGAGGQGIPGTPREILAFWQAEPRTPGLSGRWQCPAEQSAWTTWTGVLTRLWRDPGGLRAFDS